MTFSRGLSQRSSSLSSLRLSNNSFTPRSLQDSRSHLEACAVSACYLWYFIPCISLLEDALILYKNMSFIYRMQSTCFRVVRFRTT